MITSKSYVQVFCLNLVIIYPKRRERGKTKMDASSVGVGCSNQHTSLDQWIKKIFSEQSVVLYKAVSILGVEWHQKLQYQSIISTFRQIKGLHCYNFTFVVSLGDKSCPSWPAEMTRKLQKHTSEHTWFGLLSSEQTTCLSSGLKQQAA